MLHGSVLEAVHAVWHDCTATRRVQELPRPFPARPGCLPTRSCRAERRLHCRGARPRKRGRGGVQAAGAVQTLRQSPPPGGPPLGGPGQGGLQNRAGCGFQAPLGVGKPVLASDPDGTVNGETAQAVEYVNIVPELMAGSISPANRGLATITPQLGLLSLLGRLGPVQGKTTVRVSPARRLAAADIPRPSGLSSMEDQRWTSCIPPSLRSNLHPPARASKVAPLFGVRLTRSGTSPPTARAWRSRSERPAGSGSDISAPERRVRASVT